MWTYVAPRISIAIAWSSIFTGLVSAPVRDRELRCAPYRAMP